MGAAGFWDDQERAARVSAEHARATRKLGVFRELERDVDDLEPLAELAEEDPEIAAELEDQVRAVQERLDALEEERLFSGPLRRRRRAGHGQRRRRRDRRPGLGRDGPADGDALGGEARASRSSCWRSHPARRRGSSRPPSASRARTPTACTAARRACTGWCACPRSTPPTAARRASPASRSRRWSRRPAEVEIDEDDLQIDTYRASGAGGQHVNKTDSAVRITHKPTGIVVQCQNERSQSSNKAEAMAMLRSRLLELEERKRREEIARERGEAQDVNFGSQIRSYVLHPYTMVKDHRTDFEMGDANRVLDGDLDGFVRAYLLRRRSDPSRARRPADGASSRPRPTWRRSSPTASAARCASTSPATRAGPGADPGLRSAMGERALALDICQDIEGIDVGPVADPLRARRAAGRRRPTGPGGPGFSTNGATQGNHALCLALAKPGRHVLVQRNSHASIVDGLVLSGGMASFVSPEYDEELGMAHGVTPEALRGGAAPLSRHRRGVHRLADLLRDGRRHPRLRRGRPRRRRGAGRRLRLGLALRLSPGAARVAAARWAPTRCSPRPTRSSAA